MRATLFVSLLASVLLAACVGGNIAPTGGGGPNSDQTGSNGDAQPGSYTDDAATCPSTCSTPAGTVQPTTSLAEAYAQVAGRWLICTGQDAFAASGAPGDTVGVEFVPTTPCASTGDTGCGYGTFYYLVNGASGPVRGTGFAYQLTYNIVSVGTASYQLNVQPAPNFMFGASFRYSPCPQELEYELGSGALLVPVSSDATGTPIDDAGAADGPASDGDTATCPPPSSVITPDSVSQLASAVQGSWQVCTGLESLQAFAGADDVVGMQFGPATGNGGGCNDPSSCMGGQLLYLVQGPSGLVPGSGFAYQSEYQIVATGENIQLSLFTGSGGIGGGGVRYSVDPHELNIANFGTTDDDGATLLAVP